MNDAVVGSCIIPGIMKADGSIFAGEAATCFHVVLSRESLAGCERFMFHPALIDGVGIGSRILIPQEKEGQNLFVPLSFESFRACELVQRRCFARIRSGAVRWNGDLLCLNIEFFNEVGAKVAELNNFMGKLAGEAQGSPGAALNIGGTHPSSRDSAATTCASFSKDGLMTPARETDGGPAWARFDPGVGEHRRVSQTIHCRWFGLPSRRNRSGSWIL